eukprot:CAMPEP_0171123014 /NCGR_PEP_ID=MMETSP0766_2-20121228/106208_1 /TAXON_ID=439317 /ORGANISM="Gambierdiscus australes, Strain CAWD 149" /LENGTH=230 /DNA_ID=CAMNT_0011585873 /DNA_START=128 /DNA_END=820 /DNA_ORIENTATION=-
MAVVLFPGFELLDVGAPGELLGCAPTVVKLLYCAERPGPVASSCLESYGGTVGPCLEATHMLREGGLISDGAGGALVKPDAILIPGGRGVRMEVHNTALLSWLKSAAESSEVVLTVCTGSWLLGVAGGLDGIPATSNKNALRNGEPQKAAPQVLWKLNARWVEHELERGGDRKTLFVTSSGVSAGGDAALALLARLAGKDLALRVAHRAEWSWQEDPTLDPFAQAYGVVE